MEKKENFLFYFLYIKRNHLKFSMCTELEERKIPIEKKLQV